MHNVCLRLALLDAECAMHQTTGPLCERLNKGKSARDVRVEDPLIAMVINTGSRDLQGVTG